MKAILLVRVSTVQQHLDEQTNSLITYALSKGYSEDNLLIIEDKESALKLSEEERNGLNTMKAYIANDSSINAIFVWELSRLFRKQKTGYSLREYFISYHIQLFCYSPNFQLLTKDRSEVDGSGSITFALFAEMADAEMRNKKARFHRSKVRNAKTGKYSGGFIKYGYTVSETGFYEINEQEAEFIRYIFNEYEKGRSIMNLTKDLKERGKINTSNFVRGILISEAYTGLSNEYGMNRTYPQIISIEQFNRCRDLAKERNKRADKTNEIYFCKKLIKCTECGTHYIGMKSTIMYLCYGRYGKEAKIFPEKACKESPIININLLDSLAWHIVKDRETFDAGFPNPELLEELKKQIEINDEKIENCVIQLQNIERKRERNNTMYLNGQILDEKYYSNSKLIDIEVREFNNLITQSRNENKKLKKRIVDEETKKDNIDVYSNKEEYLDSLNDHEKQLLIQKHILEINVFEDEPNKTKIVVFNYDRKNAECFRIHVKKKPYLIEYDASFLFDYGDGTTLIERISKKPDWVEFPIKFEHRFERYKNN